MTKIFLAALTALSLSFGVASAQTLTHGAAPHQQQTGNQYNWLAGGD